MSDRINVGWQDIAERWEQAYLDEKARADALERSLNLIAKFKNYDEHGLGDPVDFEDEHWRMIAIARKALEDQPNE